MNMYKIYLKQAWALLKENKLLSGVSIFGTALAICMIMVIVIVWQMRTANYSPEDYRDRMMYVSDTRASYKENESYNDCYFLASRVVKDCFYPLRSAEKVGMAYHGVQRLAAVADHTVEFKCDVTFTDAAFWNIFNFRFLSGKLYGEEEVQSGIMDAVVSESVGTSALWHDRGRRPYPVGDQLRALYPRGRRAGCLPASRVSLWRCLVALYHRQFPV